MKERNKQKNIISRAKGKQQKVQEDSLESKKPESRGRAGQLAAFSMGFSPFLLA
jgi:hypothetical protein